MVKVSGKGVKKKPVVGAAPVRKLQAGIAADLQVELTPGAYALWREQLVIWLAFGGLALGAYVSGFDSLLAVWLGSLGRSGFGADVAWFLRQYGTWLGAILALVCLLVIMIPKIFARWRVVYPTALLVVVVALFGGGLLNQVMIQELADRPRPRESVLLATPVAGAELSGNSMPSGHAAMGFLLMVPFFTLRRREWGRYKHAAQGFLMGGVVAGLVVGIGRMLAGAHFLSDVLVAGAITASVASLGAYVLATRPHWWPLRARWVWLGVLLSAAAIVLGNHFKLDLRMELGPDFRRAELPCIIESIYEDTGRPPVLEVQLSGFGAPLSYLKLKEENGVVGLQKEYGIYHNLTCTARLVMPVGPFE